MDSFMLFGPQDLRRVEMPVPVPGAAEVLIAAAFTGVCGSDVHYYRYGYCGRFIPKGPFALGHEFSGVIHSFGEKVTGFNPGDLVAIDPSNPCRKCKECREGRYNLCPDMRYFGSASCDPHLNGSQAGLVAVPMENVHKLPKGISLAQASLLEPLSVAMHAVRQAGNVAGKSVLITGGGPIGQLIIRVLRAFGAARITLSDVDPFARRFSLDYSADEVIDPAIPDTWSNMMPVDIVMEASGVPSALADGIRMTRRGGRIVLVGTLPEELMLPANLIMNRELTIRGSFRFANVFEEALDLVAKSIIRLDGLITHTFQFEQTPEAMMKAMRKSEVMKVIIDHQI
jgi:L-idonate 5-dehydrogenase